MAIVEYSAEVTPKKGKIFLQTGGSLYRITTSSLLESNHGLELGVTSTSQSLQFKAGGTAVIYRI